MRAYRYLDDKYAQEFLHGRIRLLPLQHYASMETLGVHPERGDAGEGLLLATIDDYEIEHASADRPQPAALRRAFDVQPGAKGIRFKNISIGNDAPPCLVMCMSEVRDLSLALKFGARSSVEVFDLGQLVDRVSTTLRQQYGFLDCARVHYAESRTADFRDDVHEHPAWRVKEFRHKHEAELRIVWTPYDRHGWKPAPEAIDCGDLSNCARITRFW